MSLSRGVFADDANDFIPQRGLDWYKKYTLRLANVHQQAALDKVKQSIDDGIRAGRSVPEMTNDLKQVFQEFSDSRLEMIARTETMKIYNQTRYQELVGTDDISGCEISAILDSRVCSVCEARNGRYVSIGRADGFLPPFHPQCRCVILPVFAWEIDEKTYTRKYVDKSAPPVQTGWGSIGMEIPEKDNNKVYNLKISKQKQEKHIFGSEKYMQYLQKPIPEHPSYFTFDGIDKYNNFKDAKAMLDAFVKHYAGKGLIYQKTGDNNKREKIETGYITGKTWDRNIERYIDTTKFEIIYSNNNIHFYPISPKKVV